MLSFQGASPNQINYYAEMNGSSSDEPLLFIFIALICILFSIFLCLAKSVHHFLIITFTLLMFLIVPLSMSYTVPFYQPLHGSIEACGNYWLLAAILVFYHFILFGFTYWFQARKK